MQACAAGYALTYLTTPILQLAERVVGLSVSKPRLPILPFHGFFLYNITYI
jgi:hypothetical protein